MFQKSVPPSTIAPQPLAPTPAPPTTHLPPAGTARATLRVISLARATQRPPAPRQISERLASELAEPGARCCYDLFLDFSLSLCCSTAVASRPIDGALSLSSLSLSSVTQI